MFKAREAATAFRSGAVSVLAPAASPPQPLRRDARRRLRSGTEHEPPPPPASPRRAHGVAAVRWSACDSPSKYKCDMCAVSEHLHAQVLEFCCSRGAAEKEYRITKAGEPTNQEEESRPPRPAAGPSVHPSDLGSEQRIYQTAERRQIKGVVQASETQRTISDDGKLTSCQTHRSDCSKTSLLYQGPFTVARQQHRKTFYSGKALKLLSHEMTLELPVE